jgi:hypothetical protein
MAMETEQRERKRLEIHALVDGIVQKSKGDTKAALASIAKRFSLTKDEARDYLATWRLCRQRKRTEQEPAGKSR